MTLTRESSGKLEYQVSSSTDFLYQTSTSVFKMLVACIQIQGTRFQSCPGCQFMYESYAGQKVLSYDHANKVTLSWCCVTLSFLLQLNSIQFNSIQHTSIQLNFTRLISTQFNSYQFTSSQFNSTQFNSTQLNSIQLNSTQFTSILLQLHIIQLNSTHLNLTQLNSIQLNSTQCNIIKLQLQLNSSQVNSIQNSSSSTLDQPNLWMITVDVCTGS